MRRHIGLALVCLASTGASAIAQEPGVPAGFPGDFARRAAGHVASLARLGPRLAGSAGERDAAGYVRDRLAALGLDVRIEPFEFEAFVVERAELTLCGARVGPRVVGFNPYQGDLSYDSEPMFVRPDISGDELGRLDLRGRLVVTADPAPYFVLMFARPRAIAYLDAEEYAAVATRRCAVGRLQVMGTLERYASANVVGSLGSRDRDAREIIISAHYDSYRRSPGADDNASGVGVLIELARYLAAADGEPGLRVKFVAFGAEEMGVVGSRAYLDAHREEVRRCELLLNLDQVGGPRGPYVEMTGGVTGLPDSTGTNRFPSYLRNRALEGMDGRWRLVDQSVLGLLAVSNRPPWLVDLIAGSAAALGHEVVPTGSLGSDQLVFTQAGVVATGIGTSGNVYHGPQDVPGQVVADQLGVVGRLAATIVRGAMERHRREQADRH